MLWSTLTSPLEVKRTCIVLVVRAVTVTWDWLLIWLPPMISWICIKLNRSCPRKSSPFLRRLIENYIAFNSLGGWFRWIWGFFLFVMLYCVWLYELIVNKFLSFFYDFIPILFFFFLLFIIYSCSTNSFFFFPFLLLNVVFYCSFCTSIKLLFFYWFYSSFLLFIDLSELEWICGCILYIF